MANTEIFLRNIFGTTRPNIRPLVLALNITNDLLFEQHISMSDIKATKHIYPDVARLLHKKPETVYKSVIRLAHRCWDALVEQDLVLSYLGRSMKQEPDPSVFITYLAVYIQSDIPFFEFIERDPGFLFRDSPDIFGMSDVARKYGTNWKAVERNIRTVSTIAWKHNLPLLESLSHRHLDRRLRSAEFLAVLFHAVCSDEFERPA